MSRVMVAMSGGVDSSVAAALMQAEGHEVIGVTLKLWQGPQGEAPTAGCCTVSDAEDARRVAHRLGIRYYVLDYTDDFMGGVVERFVSEYASGRTPNPCIECNRTVKFSRLLSQAAELDCDLLVTGHYARVEQIAGRFALRRGVDDSKDQSYVLSMLDQERLARVRFPVGSLTKTETRRIAADLGLRTATKPESQDICFVGSGNYRDFLRSVDGAIERPGPIVDLDGTVVGSHRGVADVTIGQRRGLGVAVGEPRYVVATDPGSATVVVGPRRALAVTSVRLDEETWTWRRPDDGARLDAQFRAHGDAVAATYASGRVRFHEPQEAVAPGQTLALYDGDEVVGGGIIAGVERAG